MLLNCRNCGSGFNTKDPAFDCCSDDCKRKLHRRLLTPYSVPAPAGTEIRRPSRSTTSSQVPARSSGHFDARAAVLADRASARRTPFDARAELAADRKSAPPARTLSVREADAALSQERTPAATKHLLDAEVDDMLIRSKGLTRAGEVEKRALPDLTA
jgi:hypothetical protein